MKLTAKDIASCDEQTIELANGHSIKISVFPDETHGAPWEECEGHGPVSDWTTRRKGPDELILATDRKHKRFYDFAEAVRIAKRDGWDAKPYNDGTQTKGQQAHKAALADFEYLRQWCADVWRYLDVSVCLLDETGEEVAADLLGGVESLNSHWKEEARDMANALIESAQTEETERTYWESRDVETVKA